MQLSTKRTIVLEMSKKEARLLLNAAYVFSNPFFNRVREMLQLKVDYDGFDAFDHRGERIGLRCLSIKKRETDESSKQEEKGDRCGVE